MNLKYTLGFTLLLCGPAMAQDVYPGCETPSPVAGHHTFYVDPVSGTDAGDGSAQRPWKSLNTVLAPASRLIATKRHAKLTGTPLLDVDPKAPIKGGDTIMLRSGNYGDVVLQNTFNDKFITVMAAPGAEPVIGHLKLNGGSRWMFQGLIFQTEHPSGSAPGLNSLVQVLDGWGDTTENIIFDGDTFRTTADSSAWTDQDWYSKPDYMALTTRGTCVAVTNSTFKNLRNGIAATAPKTLLKKNTIDRFSHDAIDVIAGQVAVVNNTITNGMANPTSDAHPDAIQIWSPFANGKITTVSKDVLVDSNKIYTPKGKEGNVLMGISCGSCDNLVIQNNVVVINHWNGILINGSRNTKIVNNTIMSSDPVNHPSWICIRPNAYGVSENVLVRNNVASSIVLNDQSVTMDHNVVESAYSLLQGGKTVWRRQTDTASQNLVLPTLGSGFRNWNPTKDDFDVHLKTASAIAGKGSDTSAPSTDADGRTRSQPMDLGAFSR